MQIVGVVEAKFTARPELAVALTVTGVPYGSSGRAGNVMVWLPFAM